PAIAYRSLISRLAVPMWFGIVLFDEHTGEDSVANLVANLVCDLQGQIICKYSARAICAHAYHAVFLRHVAEPSRARSLCAGRQEDGNTRLSGFGLHRAGIFFAKNKTTRQRKGRNRRRACDWQRGMSPNRSLAVSAFDKSPSRSDERSISGERRVCHGLVSA